jgi:hypothetical protein
MDVSALIKVCAQYFADGLGPSQIETLAALIRYEGIEIQISNVEQDMV